MKLIISAHVCEFSHSPGFRSITFAPLDAPIYRAAFEARNLDELHAELDRVADALKQEAPGRSFILSEFRARADRSRAFAGYVKNQSRLKREYDANTQAAEAA